MADTPHASAYAGAYGLFRLAIAQAQYAGDWYEVCSSQENASTYHEMRDYALHAMLSALWTDA